MTRRDDSDPELPKKAARHRICVKSVAAKRAPAYGKPGKESSLFENRIKQESEAALGPRLLNVEELAARLNASQSWIYKRTKELATVWVGREPRFDWAEVTTKLKRE